MCQGCVYHDYESDTGFANCKRDDFKPDWIQDDEPCPQYYDQQDAKDDAKNRYNERY